MRRQLAATCVLAVAFAVGVAPVSFADDEQPPKETTSSPPTTELEPEIGDYLLDQIATWKRVTWRWEKLMRVRRTRLPLASRTNDAEQRQLILNAWKRKAAVRRRQARRPPLLPAWLCIKRYEGPWNDPNPPYYGGLQMDLQFQRTYGADLLRRKGTANKWTPLEQIWVAVRAYRAGRGFYPWPNTARYCNLL